MNQRDIVQRIAQSAKQRSGRVLLVGGSVRDQIAGKEPKDLDIELYGIPEAEVGSLIQACGFDFNAHGRSFAVWKVWERGTSQAHAVDLALPRREEKIGEGHADFKAVADPFMDPREAAMRRDYTMNAIMLDPLTGEVVDPFRGRHDFQNGVLRHTSKHFVEDPLRVLRGAQFCGRFPHLVPHEETIELCRTLNPRHLSQERFMEEWRKLLLRSEKPSRGLNFLRAVGWTQYYPELHAMIGVQQDPSHHPEGDAWTHTLHCVDAFAKLHAKEVRERPADLSAEDQASNERKDLMLGLSVLCHDLGKPATTMLGPDGKWHAYGHEEAGVHPTRTFLARLTADQSMVRGVEQLVAAHMKPKFYLRDEKRGTDCTRAYRRLAREVPSLELLAKVVHCDDCGRPPRPAQSEAAEHLLKRAAELNVTSAPPVPLLQGRDLIKEGYVPGPHFGAILAEAYQAQLDAPANATFTKDHLWGIARARLAEIGVFPENGSALEQVSAVIMKREALAAKRQTETQQAESSASLRGIA